MRTIAPTTATTAMIAATLEASSMPATKAVRTESSRAGEPRFRATSSPPKTLPWAADAAAAGNPLTETWLW